MFIKIELKLVPYCRKETNIYEQKNLLVSPGDMRRNGGMSQTFYIYGTLLYLGAR